MRGAVTIELRASGALGVTKRTSASFWSGNDKSTIRPSTIAAGPAWRVGTRARRPLPTPAFPRWCGAGGSIRQRDGDLTHALAIGRGTVSGNLVGTGGLEPPTSCMSSRRSNQLSYAPIFRFRALLSRLSRFTFAERVDATAMKRTGSIPTAKASSKTASRGALRGFGSGFPELLEGSLEDRVLLGSGSPSSAVARPRRFPARCRTDGSARPSRSGSAPRSARARNRPAGAVRRCRPVRPAVRWPTVSAPLVLDQRRNEDLGRARRPEVGQQGHPAWRWSPGRQSPPMARACRRFPRGRPGSPPPRRGRAAAIAAA